MKVMKEETKGRREGRITTTTKINGSHKTTFDRAISTISIFVLLLVFFFCVRSLLHFVDQAR